MLQSVNDLKDDDIISTNGKIGSIEEFYFDDTNLAVRYLVANTGNWLTGFARRLCVRKKTILPVSTMTKGKYRIDRVYLSLPCVIGREGVEKIVELPLADAEREGLQISADLMKTTLAELKNQVA